MKMRGELSVSFMFKFIFLKSQICEYGIQTIMNLVPNHKILNSFIIKIYYIKQCQYLPQLKMIILIIIIHITHQIVIYEFDANPNIFDGWEKLNDNSNFNNCGGIQYFGSPNNLQYLISRIFLDLEPHSHIRLDAQFLSIDNNAQPTVKIDSQITNYVATVTSQNSICSGASPEFLHTVSINYYHNRRTAWISIYSNYGGLISLKLSIIKCQNECAECIENYHTTCQQWKLHQYSFNKKLITYSDGWNLQTYTLQHSSDCGGCEYMRITYVTYQTELPPHQNVLIRFFKLGGQTIIVNYQYGKSTTSGSYLIEILIKNHQDPILKLIITTSSSSNMVRDFEKLCLRI
ncbi:unnamed protein product (macronuclear) [Paramecium tetraurelia]|uniref:Uncharacterized protein n=1 Tax=Paramecium tetraurelia TaxID=5888 RepID=A0D1Z2_PARTE|nr:uncharacterized protein GSPATT00039193001 [Paramecium tetraurelia]CAK77059.1 unnamed protein product [Paramecium tetraurelia]|eukprot:XP_001444456.1 hypothetical protein (macronuclear) [Paramecium tetraurelia strain d4-2]